MMSTISPISVVFQFTIITSLLLGLLLRYQSGHWTERSTLFKVVLLSLLSIGMGTSVLSLVYFLIYTSVSVFEILFFFSSAIICSAFIASCCFGRLSVVKPRDNAWGRYLKERNEGIERQRTSELADED